MIETFFNFIFQIVLALFNILLSPLDVFISTCIPWLSDGLVYINNMIDSIFPFLNWLVDLFPVHLFAIQFIVFTLVFKVTSTSSVWFIKLGIKWLSKIRGGSQYD